MSDEKIFSEIKGIFSWLEQQKKNENDQIDMESLKPSEKSQSTCNQLKEFLKFLNVEASNEEIEALNELANPDGKESKITFERFYKVFVKNEDELNQEATQLKIAFKNLTEDKNEESIPLDRLEKVLDLYDKKYKNSMEKILEDVKNSNAAKNGKFYFNDYINEQFCIKKK